MFWEKWLAQTGRTEHFFPKIKGLKVDQVPETGRQLTQLILPQVQQGQHIHLTEHHQYYYDKGLKVDQVTETGRQLNELIFPQVSSEHSDTSIKVGNILWLFIHQKYETSSCRNFITFQNIVISS
jgi:biotin operon repressor